MCYNGPSDGDTEAEREAVAPWEREPDEWKPPAKRWQDEGEDWRQGHPMGPEERAFREMLEAEDDETDDGA